MLLDILIVVSLVVLFVLYIRERRKRLARERDCVFLHEELQRSKQGAQRLLEDGQKLTQWNTELRNQLQHKDALLLQFANAEVNTPRGVATLDGRHIVPRRPR